MQTVRAVEYIAPLREGGSLPAIIRADDDQLYAVKFVGAGQGKKALVAELIAGEIGRVLGFNVPEMVLVDLDPAIGHSEPDFEIQHLLHASAGINLGLRFLVHASRFNLLTGPRPSVEFASRLVWFDAYVTNVDRTPRNVNMLVQGGQIWLIDHGACLYFHYNWRDPIAQGETRFPLIRDHVLLPLAQKLHEADQAIRAELDGSLLERIVAQVPDTWLDSGPDFATPEGYRQGYVTFLVHRLSVSRSFVEEADGARTRAL